jgi:DNA polymerase-1
MKKLIIIDCNSVIHRAFHALPPLKNRKGEMVNALYGFLLVLLKALKELKPEAIAACFDAPGPTFRHKEYKEYKAKRPKAPQELYDQIPKIKEALKVFNVSFFEKKGFEADDLIGTIVEESPNFETIVLTGDADIFQLLDKNVKVYNLKRGVKNTILYTKETFKKEYGFSSEKLVDYKALRGDASDNIPGAPGIGEKTAVEILKKYKDINDLYNNLEKKDLKEKTVNILRDNKDKVILSRQLAEIKKDVPLNLILKELDLKYKKEDVLKYFKEMGFKTLIKRISEEMGQERLW